MISYKRTQRLYIMLPPLGDISEVKLHMYHFVPRCIFNSHALYSSILILCGAAMFSWCWSTPVDRYPRCSQTLHTLDSLQSLCTVGCIAFCLLSYPHNSLKYLIYITFNLPWLLPFHFLAHLHHSCLLIPLSCTLLVRPRSWNIGLRQNGFLINKFNVLDIPHLIIQTFIHLILSQREKYM